MKDQQVTTVSSESRVFLLSPALHCVSMIGLVFLRSSFGYAFLRPKSVFFACSWAFILYAIYARIDGDAWHEHAALLWYGIAGLVLYWCHFSVTITREWRSTGGHDNYAGTSHAKTLLQIFGQSTSRHFDRAVRLWVEPGLVATLALALRIIAGEAHLSPWLGFAALCMWIKEVLNLWFAIRRKKRGRDIGDDLADSFEGEPRTQGAVSQPTTTSARKAGIKRPRLSS